MPMNSKTVSTEQAAQLLLAADNIHVLCHRAPDGDAIGSAVGICSALRGIGKRAKVICSDPFAAKYDYLALSDDDFPMGFLLCVDTADEKLFGENLRHLWGKADLCIDHHPSNTMYAKNVLLKADAGATAQIVFDVIECLGAEFTPFIANCIYTGMATDTGCFKFANTSADILYKAAKLLELGADNAMINKRMFEDKSRQLLEIERMAISTLEYHFDGRCAVMTVTREMMETSGIGDSDLEGISTIPRQIEGVVVGLTLKQQKGDTYKISVRTAQEVDASELCTLFGGGGHKRAAGCEIRGSAHEVKTKILAAVKQQLERSGNGQDLLH